MWCYGGWAGTGCFFFVLLLLRGSKFFFGAGVSVVLQQILRGSCFVATEECFVACALFLPLLFLICFQFVLV